MGITKQGIAVLALGVGAAAGYWLHDSDSSPRDPEMVVGRVWVEAKPSKKTDYVQGLFLAPKVGYGLFQRSSMFDFHLEAVKWKRDGNKLTFNFPQSNKSTDVTVTVSNCRAIPPFDLCLDLSENPWGGPKRYYSTGKKSAEADAALGAFAALPAEAEALSQADK